MPTRHKVQAGECVSSIAERYGFFPGTIWDHADNARLKQLRGDPNILSPGDVVVVPDKRVKEEQRPVDQQHRFRKKGVPAKFRLQLFDGEEPRANQQYTLAIDGQIYVEGTTDGEGKLEHDISPTAKEGKLTIGPDGFELTLKFGHLAPIGEIAGVQKRLNNLGYACGRPDGQLNDRTRSALRRFQQRFGLRVTGEADDATRNKLEELHDAVGDLPEGQQR